MLFGLWHHRHVVCGDWARSRAPGILLSFLRGWWGNTSAFRGQHGILIFQNVFSLSYFMLVNGKFTLLCPPFTHTHIHTHSSYWYNHYQAMMTVVSESQMLSWLMTNSDDWNKFGQTCYTIKGNRKPLHMFLHYAQAKYIYGIYCTGEMRTFST